MADRMLKHEDDQLLDDVQAVAERAAAVVKRAAAIKAQRERKGRHWSQPQRERLTVLAVALSELGDGIEGLYIAAAVQAEYERFKQITEVKR